MKIIVTAGPTREFIDPVRYLSNPATGRLGYLVAAAALRRGHRVVLISGPTHLKPPAGAEVVQVISAVEMERSVVRHFPAANALVMTAAVSDWRPARTLRKKIKMKKPWSLRLVPNPDILHKVSQIKRSGQIIIGFALETEARKRYALTKMKAKKMDLVIADSPGYFGQENSASPVLAISAHGEELDLTGISKNRLACFLIRFLENHHKRGANNLGQLAWKLGSVKKV
ncbi:MAG TPA: phosphopantothenoylcysteine decarboxylase, partial [bacterium]|nr:phosphopantothenoylcysteine decarboxylase [bacterium]